jgi:hypothetical protein
VAADDENPSLVRQSVGYTVRDTYDATGNKYIFFASQHPSVMTFVNADGSVTVCVADESAHDTYIYEYSKDMALIKTMKFHNERKMLGAFTKDGEGNYYLFYAENVGKDEQDRENMAMVKYDPSGSKQKTYQLKAQADKSFDGIQLPFDASTCRLELSGSMLAVYFAREMFSGHQACYGFILNKDTFERIDKGAVSNSNGGGNMMMPYVSHSFNQFILPIDGGFIFADHGDARPRGFTFAKFLDNGNTKRLHSFEFEGRAGQNGTYAELGGLAKTSTGYIFAGTYGYNVNKSRNVLILTFDDDLSACSEPLWLTDYTPDTGHAAHPKIIDMDDGRYMVVWERCEFSTQSSNQVPGSSQTGYKSTYMCMIDEQGKPLTAIKELPAVRLNINDVLRYNKVTGNVHWAVNDGNHSIALYSFNPDKKIEVPAKSYAGDSKSLFAAHIGIYFDAGYNTVNDIAFLDDTPLDGIINTITFGADLQLGITFKMLFDIELLAEGGIGLHFPYMWGLYVGGIGKIYMSKAFGLGFGGGIRQAFAPDESTGWYQYLRGALLFKGISLYGDYLPGKGFGFGFMINS